MTRPNPELAANAYPHFDPDMTMGPDRNERHLGQEPRPCVAGLGYYAVQQGEDPLKTWPTAAEVGMDVDRGLGWSVAATAAERLGSQN